MKSRTLGAGALCAAFLALPVTAASAVHHAPSLAPDKTVREHVRDARDARRQSAYRAASVPAHLQAIAACESGGDPRAIGGGGLYRGKYQFDRATWASVGGSGDPAAAPEAEQDARAAQLYAQTGGSAWPNCG